ncbi:hypothetical protein VTL71DRAFT_9080 [Oculimacula yallundae]|uniref:Defensin n=1 Tax=Oculimacula yallundae TaxID=86028 RepID=A0ABR4BWC4_9HELO
MSLTPLIHPILPKTNPNTFQFLISLLTLLLTFATALPTPSPISTTQHDEGDDDETSTNASIDVIFKAQYTLVCHAGLSASVCAAEYATYCSDNGGFFSHGAPDGKSCTSRQCYCSR